MLKKALFGALINYFFLASVSSEDPITLMASCGLEGIPTDTSTRNLYPLPPIDENIAIGTTTWNWPYYGDVTKTTVNPSSDHQYLDATFDRSRKSYRIFANSLTKDFVRLLKRRQMTRYITIYCRDGSSIRYFFKIPVQDMTPPRFEKSQYNFTITHDWNPLTPISEGQFVIVSDNAFEIGEPSMTFDLKFEASVDDVVDIRFIRLWSEPNQSRYYYRLDLFIIKDLKSGDEFQIIVTAKDQFSGGTTRANIVVL